jgi:hypothetical protein
MNKEELFSVWAPDASVWSPWVKPVLFAHIEPAPPIAPDALPEPEVSWAPAASERYALVLDLPGVDGVFIAMAMAEIGYRPVPLFNALPSPAGTRILDPATGRAIAAVNVLPILSALRDKTSALADMKLPADAPPVFILDANRRGDRPVMYPDEFDNRAVCFTTDFPSANFLGAHGIHRALLVQQIALVPQPDLAHVLRRWQEAGVRLERKQLASAQPLEAFEVARPSWFGSMFQRALIMAGLRRGATGGFGAWVPEASGGG